MTNETIKGSRGDARRDAGRAHFTQVLGFMLKDVSHPEMALLADWALDETGCLHTSQISHLKNQKMRMLGVKSLDSLGRINVAAYAYKTDRAAFKKLGTAQTTARIEEILARYEPVLKPGLEGAVDAGGLMMIYLGYVEIPDLVPAAAVDSKQLNKAASEIGPWVEALIEERGLKFRDGLALLKAKWSGSSAGGELFCQVVAGLSTYSPTQLSEDLENVAKVISDLIDEDMTGEEIVDAITA